MTIKPLSQRDPRWSKKTLGFSTKKIGSFGCTLTSLTMLLNYVEGKNYTPPEVNERLKAVKAFSGALLVWARVPLAFPSLKFIWRNYKYDNIRVAWYVYGLQMPVMVEVDFDGTPRTDDRHWVLYVGGLKLADPWTGTLRTTKTYPAIGYSLYQRSK